MFQTITNFIFYKKTNILIYFDPVHTSYDGTFFKKLKTNIKNKLGDTTKNKFFNVKFIVYHIKENSKHKKCYRFLKKLQHYFVDSVVEIQKHKKNIIFFMFAFNI